MYNEICNECYSLNYLNPNDTIDIHYVPNFGCRCWNCDNIIWLSCDLNNPTLELIVDGQSSIELED